MWLEGEGGVAGVCERERSVREREREVSVELREEWPVCEGESDVWGPHVSEWRERSSRGCFGPYERCVHVYGLTVGPDTRKT